MTSQARTYLLMFGIVIVIPLLGFITYVSYTNSFLSYYGPELITEDGKKMQHKVHDFRLLNQNGEAVTGADMEEKISVVAFFFTSCPVVCPKMTANMLRVYEAHQKNTDFQVLMFTVDPERDTPEKLKRYAEKFKIPKDNWHLLTGKKQELYLLARNSYFITAVEGTGGEDDFIHSERFVLIDQQGHIRGFYDGLNETEVDKLIKDIKKLT